MVRFKGDTDLTVRDDLLVVYLVWVWHPSGWFSLRSVSLTPRHALYAKQSAKSENARCKVLVEETTAEHMFGLSLGKASGMEPPDGYEGLSMEPEKPQEGKL